MDIELKEEKRWLDIDAVLKHPSKFAPDDFTPGDELKSAFMEYGKVLVVGAGGLGCEILKDLALMGFKDIHVIDLDTIDLTNLNRQFLFRMKDVGQYKSKVAADFVMKRVPGCKITSHISPIQKFDKDFYSQFQVIIAGLDNIEARRWLNFLVHSLVEFENGEPKPETVHPLIDGGTEGFRGQARVIWPLKTACFECTLGSLPKQHAYNMCTIANTPRIAEHCIAYAFLIQWGKELGDKKLDKDDPEHMRWIYEKALERAAEYKISGVTLTLTQGVVKNIIPAIASTNALIAAACSNEAFKIMTGCSKRIEDYMMFMGQTGIYTNTFPYQPKDDCLVCSSLKVRTKTISKSATIADFLKFLTEELELEKPSIVNHEGKSIYISNLASMYEDELKTTFGDFVAKGTFTEKPELFITDRKIPTHLKFSLTLE